jgi:hypothetical protein
VEDDEDELPEEITNPTGMTESKTNEPVSRKDTGKFENELEGHSEQILGQIANSDINFGRFDQGNKQQPSSRQYPDMSVNLMDSFQQPQSSL